MKEKLLKLLEAKKNQRTQLNASMIEADSKEERAAIGETLSALSQEIADIEAMIAEIDEPAEEAASADEGERTETENENERGMNIMATMNMRTAEGKNAETRANEFAKSGRMQMETTEVRAVLVSSGDLATPTEVAGINDVIGARVSSIVDLVKITDASGMGAYKVAYQETDATAATQTEGAAYNASEPKFDFVEIKPQTEAVLSYISKQARKQTPLNYTEKVEASAKVALRKRAAKIVTDAILDSELVTALAVPALAETTLRKIAFNYGGDESIVGAATLFINKADLVALGDVRGSDKKPVYEITPDASNPNTGVIKDGGLAVPYCINSNLPAGTLLYGQAHNCELALFSSYEISVSEDFAFDKGLLAVRGDVELGAGVVAKGGFVKATIGG